MTEKQISFRNPFLRVACLGLVSIGWLCGCSRYEYTVELKPTDNALERTVTLKSARDSFFSIFPEKFDDRDRKELERIAAIYDMALPKDMGRKVAYSSKAFSGALPPDVGGAGHYVRFDSPLGSAFGYIERLRGNDDLFGQFEQRRLAVDEFVNHIVGWFESELGNDPGWPALKTFFETTLRHDLQNVSFYSSMLQNVPILQNVPAKDKAEFEQATANTVVRIAQYLAERNYIAYEDIPATVRVISRPDAKDWPTIVNHSLQKILAAKLGSDQQAFRPEKFEFFTDPVRCDVSWRKYFEATAYFQSESPKRVAKLEMELAKEVETLEEFGSGLEDQIASTKEQFMKRRADVCNDVWRDLCIQAFVPWLGTNGHDRYRVSMEAKCAPVCTNGSWNADKRRVTWEGTMEATTGEPARAVDIPQYCYAIWDEPNEETQQPLFGSNAIDGPNLIHYCAWYEGLTDDEKRQWDEFLPTVKSDAASLKRLKQFHFADEPPPTEDKLSLANPAIEIVTEALEHAKK